jgi:PAS domain S-box-containing protein
MSEQKGSVLFIDDDEMSRNIIGSYLRERGYEVHLASHGEQGLEIFARERPDVVLLDLRMPGMDGLQVLERLVESSRNTAVLVVSGAGEMKDVIQAMRHGAWNYVIKSLENLSLLDEAVIRALNEQQLILDRERYQKELQEALSENEFYRMKLESIFQSLPDGLISVDNEMRVMEYNQAMQELCPKGGEFELGAFFTEIGQDNGEYCLSILRRTLRDQKPVYNKRVECPAEHPSKRVFLVTATPMRDREGAVTGATLITRDISRQEELEEKLQEKREFRNIVGKSPHMQKIFNLIQQLSNVDTTVLITGESGTGKEVVVDALHYSGHRSKGPLYKVNCAALSEELLDSELFGHVRGAFTGAYQNKTGRVEVAQGGTLFLDEIGEISHRIQLKLLRFLETKEFERVGSSQIKRADVRIVSATNLDLQQKVQDGGFREDLYYRLKVMNVHIPPLRERKEDIPLLVDHFCKEYSRKFDKKITGVSDDVMRLFMKYPWQGNVRELKHILEHGSLFCPGGKISREHLPGEILEVSRSGPVARVSAAPHEELTQERIERAIKEAGGNKSKAADVLGIHRKTLYRKMHRLGMDL